MRIDVREEAVYSLNNKKLPNHEHIDHRPEKVEQVYKPSVCIDFDGVIHSYESKWSKATIIPDLPVAGAFDSINTYLDNGLRVYVFSTRSETPEGLYAMRQWFAANGFKRLNELEFPKNKPPALLYIDDRAYTFKGIFPPTEVIRNFKPWNKK